jgi:uncharacterized protein (TIGR00251 family)
MPDQATLPAFVTQRRDGAVLSVYLTPRSSNSGIGPFEVDTVRVRVTAAAVDGAANAALIRLLAESVRVPKSMIEIVAGKSARRKRLLIRGLDATELLKRLEMDRDAV